MENHVPDDTDALREVDIFRLAETDPEQASIVIDGYLKQQVSDERESWIVRARMVNFYKEKDLWRYHPMGFSSLFEYCQQPEIDIPPSVVSDMLALCKYENALADAGYDVWDVIRKAGHSKVRQIIPQIREADRDGTLAETVGPIIDAIDSMSFREVLELTSTSGVRTQYDYEVVYREQQGKIEVTFRNLDIDALERLAQKNKIKRWYDEKGNRIEPPMEGSK